MTISMVENLLKDFKVKTRKKAALLNFYSSQNIGILVTTKPGQENLKTAIILKDKIENDMREANMLPKQATLDV